MLGAMSCLEQLFVITQDHQTSCPRQVWIMQPSESELKELECLVLNPSALSSQELAYLEQTIRRNPGDLKA
jgi:hypothetical protein